MRPPLENPRHDRCDVTTRESEANAAIGQFFERLRSVPRASLRVSRALLAEIDDHAVPSGTSHWRILRFTAGRPKVMPGRFDLELTAEQLLEMCGPGRYRIEALDEYGRSLAEVATVNVGGASSETPGELVPNHTVRMIPTSDTRIMLETIAQMSRAHSESLQSLASAQAEWIKTLATAKQIPRNGIAAIPPQLSPQVATEPQEPEPWWSHLLKPSALTAIGDVARNLISYFGPKEERVETPKRRNSALAEIADRTAAAAKEAQAKAATDLEHALEQAYQRANGRKPQEIPKETESQSSMEKSS